MNSNKQFMQISTLNLEPIKVKLMHQESGEGWSQEKANAVEIEYRRFLLLMKLFPQEDTAPLVEVDTFWHYHILDTMKYAADCEQAFGYFLHHYPYVGMRGEGDEGVRQASAERMRELYEDTFGERYLRTPAPAETRTTAYCGASAKAAYCGVTTKPENGCVAELEAAYCGVTGMAYCGSTRSVELASSSLGLAAA